MELVHKAYRFRLYPNQRQQQLMAKTFGCVRLVYNHYLDQKTSILYEYVCDENQVDIFQTKAEDFLGIDYAMDGMAVFSDGSRCEYLGKNKNRGIHGDSLWKLSPLGLSSRKPPLQTLRVKWWEHITSNNGVI